MATLIRTNGTFEEVYPQNGTYFTLDECQNFVGGFIQIINLKDDEILVVNEEGIPLGLPYNSEASLYAFLSNFPADLVGDVLLCHTSQVR